MIFYISNIIVFILYSAFFKIPYLNRSKVYFWVVVIHFSSLMGLRSYTVGTDTPQYVSFYESQNFTFNSNGASIYNLLSKFIWNITNGNYHVFIFVLSFLTIYLFSKSFMIYNHGLDYFFLNFYIYISFYYYFESFNMQRQMLAVAISMFAMMTLYNETSNNRIIKSLILLFIAIGIHSTAIIAILGLIIWKIKKSKSMLFIMSAFIAILSFFMDKILMIFIGYFSHYSMYENTVFGTKYSTNGGTAILGLFLIIMIVSSITFTDILKDEKVSFALFMTQVGGILYILGSSSQLIIRMAVYFGVYSMVLLPSMAKYLSFRFKNKSIIYILIVALFMSVGLVILIYKLSNNLGNVIPYIFMG
ncbi:EpsG family protein [Companilactobacillus sp. HBUAS59699]|uniref:EpsG family protein n=1 Tax=Companilactobacillus sp. HBUAS59699 TaxID=3109358 RepID=UPI002FF1F60E